MRAKTQADHIQREHKDDWINTGDTNEGADE